MKICSIDGCGIKSRALGLCATHYSRKIKNGDPLIKSLKPPPNLAEVFMKYVNKIDDGCWIWTGAKTKGYGKFRMKEKNIVASRASWLLNRDVPENFSDLLVCHHCDNPSCVKPDHLFLGTTQENVNDKMAKGRHDPGRGVAQKNAKLDDDKVRFIRQRSMTGPQLAEKFDVSLALIKAVRTGKKWKHVI